MLFLTALVLGAAHAFAPDHLAAIGVFVSRRPHWRRALMIGARWAVGHATVILFVGSALVLTGWRLPDAFAPIVERLIGITLIGLGGLALLRALRIHGHVHEHDGVPHWHLHSHRRSLRHDHAHNAAFGMGMLHGLAGTGALVIALPLAVAESVPLALAYLVAFGAGTIVGMATFSALAGWAAARTARRSLTLIRATSSGAAIASVVIGAWWVIVAR